MLVSGKLWEIHEPVIRGAECAMSDKICIWCKQDCSTKPRQKDKQGRYLCQECVKPYLDAMKPKPSADVAHLDSEGSTIPLEPAPAGGGGGMGELLAQQVAKVSDTCPSCSRPMSSGAVICTHCGFSTESGRQLRSRVSVQKAPKDAKEKKRISLEASPLWVPGGLTVVFGVFYAAAFSEPAHYFVPFLVSLAIFSFLLSLYVIIAAFGDEHGFWGILGIAAMFVPVIGLAMLFYVFFISHRTAMKASYAMVLLFAVLMIPLAMQWAETVQ